MTNSPERPLRNPPNINVFWGALIVEELIRNGADFFVVSPGSRSTPVAWAVATNPRARSLAHFDERGAAYCALGHAKVTGRPAVLVATSGTAVANYFPAVVEAASAHVPLIVLSADRPPELIDSGANQAINQLQLFGPYARWFINLPCPAEAVPARTVLTAIDQAVYRATRAPAGPVHINLQLREPLAPIETPEDLYEVLAPVDEWETSGRAFTRYNQGRRVPSPESLERLAGFVGQARRGLIIAGETRSPAEAESVMNLARTLQWPVFADITSGLRLGPDDAPLIAYFDQLLFSEKFRDYCRPDMVIQIGSPYVSKRLARHIQLWPPDHYIMAVDHPFRHDPMHLITDRFEAPISEFCDLLAAAAGEGGGRDEAWLPALKRYSDICGHTLQHLIEKATANGLNEVALAHLLPGLVPVGATLFLSSSMPIRDVDMYGQTSDEPLFAVANRGASGIDGVLASAAGYAHGSGKPVVLLIGDLALLHDLNSLALLAKIDAPVIAVVVNNQGGAIFSFLPIAAFPEHFEKFWGAAHTYSFESAAHMFTLPHVHITSADELRLAMANAIQSGLSTIIEVTGHRDQNATLHKTLQEQVRAALDHGQG